MEAKHTYIIGIDLGTTNCTMAYCKLDDNKIHQFAIPQLSQGSTEGEGYSLPSFLYFPLEEEAKADQIDSKYRIGEFAKARGSEVPTRVIASAKSWLCHAGIDRKAPLLPIDFENEAEQISPLKACAELLNHMRQAWQTKMDVNFDEQQIFITVPASFDPSARQLVEEAAKLAHYPPVILLEEPQAAFYAWLNQNQESWRKRLKVGDTILVVDVGGGTTDFSLISVDDQNGDLGLNRIAVGSHLLLGGDNFDLSLAYLAKSKLEEAGHFIDDWQLRSLTHLARQAKEQLFSANPKEKIDLTLMGRGSKLIAKSLSATILLKEAEDLIVNGFMPIVKAEERSFIEKRLGLQQIGLPFAKDARITAQLAKFLSMTGESESESMENFVLPTAVLFNGGTMKADAFRNRIVDQINSWAEKLNKDPVVILEESDLDYAVSKGAVSYGLSRLGQSIRIRSGASRSFYVGVEDSMPAVPGFQPNLKAICIVPFGMEEGTEENLSNQEFSLVVGEPTLFRFFSHATKNLSDGAEATVGTIVRNWKQELTELPAIESHLDKSEGDGKVVRVTLKSRMTELGVLELWCVSKDGRQWKLEFETRETFAKV
jgi:hypothetical protein